jgi:hypothetical protein
MTSERLRELVREMRRNTGRRTDREIQAWANELDGLLVDMEAWPWPRLRDDGKLNRWHEYEHDDDTGSCIICGWVRQVHTEHEIGASAKCPPCVALDWPEESVAASKGLYRDCGSTTGADPMSEHEMISRLLALARYKLIHCNDMGEDYMWRCYMVAQPENGGEEVMAGKHTWIRADELDAIIGAAAALGGEGRPEDVTRFVLVDEDGRICDRWNHRVELVYQDEGRTLKVFLTRRVALTDQGRRP